MELLPAYYRWIYSNFLKHIHGQTVELGCGAAIGLTNYIKRPKHIYAVDHNEKLLEKVAQKYPSKKVTPLQADLIGEWDFLPESSQDTILMMDVVEHFKDDTAFIQKSARLLVPGGKLLIKVPADPSLYCSIDQASGHYRRYDEAMLAKLAEDAGLEVQEIYNNNILGALAYKLKRERETNFSRTFSTFQLKVINLLIPLIRLADILPLPGLSIMCVMKKP